MEAAKPTEQPLAERVDSDIEVGVKFLTTLFAESDTIIFRPIETWSDADKKTQTRVDHKNRCYRKAVPGALVDVLNWLHRLSEKERLNLFFGVCPRIDDDGRFDLAWQIRTVRALWTDIDHVTVEEAQDRIANSPLPPPSILVNSGNGVHAYWLLNEPYLIDDAGDPPPVEKERTELPSGRKIARKYITEDGERVYLDHRPHASRLSVKAQHLQDVLAGVAQTVGGDHTKDLSRLLRIPGTLNRKNQRNGQEPVATALVDCDPTRRYPLSEFEKLKAASPASEQAKQIALMPLPTPRKASASNADKLAELIATSSIARAGTRSEADFAVCCFAIRKGIAREEVWPQVKQVGKFAEQGRRYFDTTWENAEYDVRSEGPQDLQKKLTSKGNSRASASEPSVGRGDNHLDGEFDENEGSDKATIYVDTEKMPVSHTLARVTEKLLSAGDCFNRADHLVVINRETVSPILSAKELAGLLSQHVEFRFAEGKGKQYKPLPAIYGNTWLHNAIERGRLPEIKLFTRNPVFTEDWRLTLPGYDPSSGIYYAGPDVQAGNGTKRLDALLKDFCFKSPADRTNYLGMLLTTILIPRFIGSKPAVLFNGNQAGLGKSMLAQIIATLRDGRPAETVTYNPNDEEFEKRLGAVVRRGDTTIIIDNAKTRGRSSRIESACLERSITDYFLSFRILGQTASIRVENSHIFCITANTPEVSHDLVTRSVVVNLYYEGDPKRRTFSIADPEGYATQYRVELLGELIGMVERWKAAGMPKANIHSRFNKRGWGPIIGGILEACGEPDFLANADEAAASLDETRREFTEMVGILVEHRQGTWSPADLVELCRKNGLLTNDLGEGSPRSQVTKLGTLAGRFVAECFELADGRHAEFHKAAGRKGALYRVAILESAEP